MKLQPIGQIGCFLTKLFWFDSLVQTKESRSTLGTFQIYRRILRRVDQLPWRTAKN